MYSMYDPHLIAVVVVDVGVGVVVGSAIVAAVAKAAAIVVEVVKIVDCYAAVEEVAAEAVPEPAMVDW